MSIIIVNGNLTNEIFEELNKSAKEYYNKVWHEVMDDCNNKKVLEIVKAWKNGQYIHEEEFKIKYCKEDFNEAYGRIMEIISMGCG